MNIRVIAYVSALSFSLCAVGAMGAKDQSGPIPKGRTVILADVSRQAVPAPARKPNEGVGPFRRLVVHQVTLIDGTGSPPYGPVNVIVEGNRIMSIAPGAGPIPSVHSADEHHIDGRGMYLLPGFVDTHTHGPGSDRAPDLGYAYKLWLAHGITTIRSVPLAEPTIASSEKNRSAANDIVAPRIFNYQPPGAGWPNGPITSPNKARQWVRWAAKNNIDGVKFFSRPGESAEIVSAAIDEAHKFGMGTVAHLSQTGVANLNARNAGDAGLDTVTHFYGHLESLLRSSSIQRFSNNYNYFNEQDRFSEVPHIIDQIYPRGSKEWREYLEHQKANKVIFDPTFNIYMANRDLMRAKTAEWHAEYTMPSLWSVYSDPAQHGSYFYDWGTEQETDWKQFYAVIFALVNDYKNMGGRVTVGTDEGFIYKLYGFGFIEELEALREAGFTPLETIRSATMWGADALYGPKGINPPIGVIRVGMLADMVLVKENPLANFKTLYGTGQVRFDMEAKKSEVVGGVSLTIKDGVVYDAKQLLADVAQAVAAAKATRTQETAVPVSSDHSRSEVPTHGGRPERGRQTFDRSLPIAASSPDKRP